MRRIEFDTVLEAVTESKAGRAAQVFSTPFIGLRRAIFFGLVLVTAILSGRMMYAILAANGMTVVEWFILGLFMVTFSWLIISFWSGVAGFLCSLFKRDPLSLGRAVEPETPDGPRLEGMTAIVMPVYNEEPGRVLAGLEATYRSLKETGQADNFHLYILSDTRKPEIAEKEEAGWRSLVKRLGAEGRLFYRRREKNTGRKAGNIADFCCRWGRQYDHMIVLDADSVMSGDTLVTLARTMQANPEAGIIQTVPLPVRQSSFFGRYVQFAARLYSPMLARGIAFWQMGESNYWGHNAIIRMQAFLSHGALPELPGKAPLGGEILSHDFVEASFLRRGNWKVYLMSDLRGSYEEVPGNVLDYAKRDKRWAQGNLQHLKLFSVSGLHPISRLHFVMGALAYASSLLWLLLLLLTTVDGVTRAVVPHDFFGDSRQLFPNWEIVKHDEIMSLFGMTIIMLLGPKIAGLGLTLADSRLRRSYGGGFRLVGSATAETLFSILLAPVMMCLHAYFVLTTLAGQVVTWDAQNRDTEDLTFADVIPRLWVPTVLGLAWGIVTWVWTPSLFYWLLPVSVGMLLAIPLTVWSSRAAVGQAFYRYGLLLTPEEVMTPDELRHVDSAVERGIRPVEDTSASVAMVPAEVQSEMHAAPLAYWDDGLKRWAGDLMTTRGRARILVRLRR